MSNVIQLPKSEAQKALDAFKQVMADVPAKEEKRPDDGFVRRMLRIFGAVELVCGLAMFWLGPPSLEATGVLLVGVGLLLLAERAHA